MIGNVWGTYKFPTFASKPLLVRETLGGWSLHGDARFSNGPLISNPGSTGGNANNPSAGNPGFTYTQLINPDPASRNYNTFFNPCWKTSAGVLTDCTSANPNPAFQQQPLFTLNTLGPYMNIRQIVHPLADASLFKTFKLRGSANFEIRGEFFNVLNTPNFGGPGTTPTSGGYGANTSLSQANDPRLTQLTARFNF
jgi:hypothetical protein